MRLPRLPFQRYYHVFISLSVLALALLIKLSGFQAVETLQLQVFDTYQRLQPRTYIPLPVRIVDIDDESLQRLGQWPWPRRTLAEMITTLKDYGVVAIALDILFAEPDRTSPRHMLEMLSRQKGTEALMRSLSAQKLPDHDAMLATAMKNAGNVVTSFFLKHDSETTPVLKAGMATAGGDPVPYLMSFGGAVRTLPELEEAAAGNGAFNSSPDYDGIIRKLPLLMELSGKIYPSLAAETLRVAQGASTYIVKSSGASGEESFGQNTGITSIKVGEAIIPTDSNGKLWVYYTLPQADRYIPAWQLFEGSHPQLQSALEGAIVFIGTSAAGLRDIRATPLSPAASGVEVHAQAIEQVLTGQFLQRPDWMTGAEILSIVVLGIALVAAMHLLNPLISASLCALVLTLMVGASWLAFSHYGLLVDPVYPAIALGMIYLSGSLTRFIRSEKERRHIRRAFSLYMSPAMVEQLARDPSRLKLGGETRDLSILFCDIRNFTTISEHMSAQSLTRFINDFLTPMTHVIMQHNGTIDKYIGDCIMAFWNAPVEDSEHALRACRAALNMRHALTLLNLQHVETAPPELRKFFPMQVGIGINTGECVVGNLGSEQRFDYSVIGDEVNFASRLEGQTKAFGIDVIIGEETARQVPHFATLEIDLIRVRGKTKTTRIYALLGDEVLAGSQGFRQFHQNFSAMLIAYRSQQWQEAIDLLDACDRIHLISADDLKVSLMTLYRERIDAFLAEPPPEDWTGVHEAKTK